MPLGLLPTDRRTGLLVMAAFLFDSLRLGASDKTVVSSARASR
jgi:hypothetical protein